MYKSILCVLLIPFLVSCASYSGTPSEWKALDQAAQAVIEGKKVDRYYVRLEPWTIRAASKIERSVPTLTIPAGERLALRVNCGMDFHEGGWQYRDDKGRVWLADNAWSDDAQWGVEGGGAAVRDEKALALDPAVELDGMYRAERYAMKAYRFHLPAGRYDLRLHFLESYDLDNAVEGRRVFDVLLNGKVVMEKFDPVRVAGKATPAVMDFENINLVDGRLEIGFASHSDEPAIINGIEIFGQSPLEKELPIERGEVLRSFDGPVGLPDTPGPVVGRYLCGVSSRARAGYELVTEDGVWLPDVPGAVNGLWAEKGGAGERHWPIVFTNTITSQIFSYERFGGEGYQIKVPRSGPYAVRLHFAEGFEGTYRPGLRVYNVSVEGHTVLEDFDAVEAGGGFARASVVEVRGVRVEDGQLSIGLEDKIGKNLINAVEVFEDADPPEEITVRQILGPAERPGMEIPNAARRKPLRVFYVGNSHTFFWAIPETTAAMVNAVDVPVRLFPYRLLHGGWVLNRFYSKRNDVEAPYAPDIIRAGRYDVAVLQLLPNADPDFNGKMLEALEAFGQAADEVGTRLMLYIFNPLDRMDDASREKLLAMVRERDMIVVPFGEARQELLRRLPDAPVDLSMRGVGPHLGFHPAYLDGCMHFIAWTGQSPVGHPTPTLVGQDVRVDEESARWLEHLAWEEYCKAKEQYGFRHYGETVK